MGQIIQAYKHLLNGLQKMIEANDRQIEKERQSALLKNKAEI